MVTVLLRPRQVLKLGSLLKGTRPYYASHFLDKRMAFSVVERGCRNAKDYRVYFSKQQRAIEKASLARVKCVVGISPLLIALQSSYVWEMLKSIIMCQEQHQSRPRPPPRRPSCLGGRGERPGGGGGWGGTSCTVHDY